MRVVRNLAFVLTTAALTSGCGLEAQTSLPANQATPLRDASTLKPPAGARVAIIEYQDLECPFCAKAFPFVHAAAKQYSIPLVECDFQIPYHHWSHDAAVCAHYLKAKASPTVAEEYRREIFAMQNRIASRDDLHTFTQAFFAKQRLTMPFVMDPNGQFAREVDATTAQGHEVGIRETPSIFVVTNDRWIQVKDPALLDEAIRQAEAEAAHKPGAAKPKPRA